MTAREQLNRRLPLLLGGYVAGLALMLVGVLALGSRWVVGGALLLMGVVSAVGYVWLRCPVCRNSILHYNLGELRSWWSGPEFCPFCVAALAEAEAEAETAPATASSPTH